MTYEQLLDELNSLSLAVTTMYFDALTIAPRDGAPYRSKAISILSGELFKRSTSDEAQQIINDATRNPKPFVALGAKSQLKDLQKIKNIPLDEFVAFNKLKNDAQVSWETARESKDYSIFKDDLEKLIEFQRNVMTYRNETKSTYELCLGDYEEGLNQEIVDQFFSTLEQDLVPFIDTVINAQSPKPEFLSAYVSVKEQEQISDLICNHLGYTKNFGHLGHAAHPFSSTFSINDSRITTHIYENDFTSNIFSIIHEIGHSMYNHQVNPDFEGYPVADNMSMSMHESQSRLLENMIGRSRSFWIPLYPQLQAIIPHVLNEVSLDEFIRGINFVERGKIRVEADELTYPLHIMVRYNVEREIFENNYKAAQLDRLFAQEMSRLIGVSPDNASEGILQDVHWSDASFGYFPTYALGTAYAAQFMSIMRKDLDVDKALETGNVSEIFDWLKLNIHQFGGMYTAQEMLQRVTKEPFNPHYYIEYLKSKYSSLLGI